MHGANRLASNSLLEAGAFGRRAGRAAAQEVQPPKVALRTARASQDLPPEAMAELRVAMTRCTGVVRDEEGLSALIGVIDRLAKAHPEAVVLTAARLIAEGALDRRESRGGHYRADYPDSLPAAAHTRMRLTLVRTDDDETAVIAALAATI
ncbi:L-aspartate oxidase [compost metagenome]